MRAKINYTTRRFIRDFWLVLEGQRAKFVTLLLLVVGAGSLTYVTTYLLGKIVDFFIKYNSGNSLNPFYKYVAVIAVLSISASLIRQNAKLELSTLGANLRKKIRLMALSKLADIEMKWHEKENTGSKIQKT